MKKAQVSVIEILLVLLLFSAYYLSVGIVERSSPEDHKARMETLIDAVYYDNNSRNPIMREDLSSSSVTANWTNITNLLDSEVSIYQIQLSNLSYTKDIVLCNATYEKWFVERVFAIENNTNYEFKILRLGVCI